MARERAGNDHCGEFSVRRGSEFAGGEGRAGGGHWRRETSLSKILPNKGNKLNCFCSGEIYNSQGF